MTKQSLSPSVQEAVLKRVEETGSEMIGFLQELVRIPTVNPPGEHYVANAELIGGKAQGNSATRRTTSRRKVVVSTRKNIRV